MTATAGTADSVLRDHIAGLVHAIEPWDEQEAQDRQYVLDWIATGADLFRVRKPDVPAVHLVSYFVVRSLDTGRIMLVDHVNAGLLLPTGVHLASDLSETSCRLDL